MGLRFLLVLFTIFPFCFNANAQGDMEEPLIPKAPVKKEFNTDVNELNDPFRPKTTEKPIIIRKSLPTTNTPTLTSTVKPDISEQSLAPPQAKTNSDEFGTTIDSPKSENLAPNSTSDKIETSNTSDEVTPDKFEEDLLKGSDDDFKPAPLKIGNEIGNEVQSPNSETKINQTQIPTPTPTQSQLKEQIPIQNSTFTPTPELPSSTILKKPILQTQEQITPSELVTEEVDPWDDPRKNVSTTCRLHLERIKKKKRMLSKVEATQFKIQDTLKGQVKGDREALKAVSAKLENSISDLKRELSSLKEKTIRLGCPGVDY